MKLWMKLALITSGILLCAGIAMEVVAIQQAGRFVIEQVVDSGIEEVEKTLLAITNERQMYETKIWNPAVQKTFLDYALKKYGGDTYLIMNGDEVISNLSDYEPVNMEWEETRNVQYREQKQDGERLLIFCKKFLRWSGERPLYLMKIKNVTYLYQDMKQQQLVFGGICIGLTLLLAFFIFLIVQKLLKPLEKLKNAAQGISRGELIQEIDITSQDEVGTVAVAFNQMSGKIQQQVKELEEVAARRQQLLGSLAHEMKTPMTSIIGYSDTLLKVKLNEEQKQKSLQYIQSECRRLERLSGKLMSLIGLYENGTIEMTPVSVEQLLGRVKKLEEVRLKEKQMSLSISNAMGEKEMDIDLMESLLLNLIDNGMKASREGAVIDILAVGNKITVRDYGRGIPEEEIQRVTEAFYMVDKSRSRKSGGVGLGLALCQQVALLHNGHLEIESRMGEGTSVSMVFHV